MNDTPTRQRMPDERLLNELDEFATQWNHNDSDDQSCRRDNRRRKFRTSCDIWYLTGYGVKPTRQKAQTRNLSERGVALLLKCVILRGTPIEIRIELPNRPPMYLAGTVAFCRYIRGRFHEIGVSLKAQQSTSIFANDPIKGMTTMKWLDEALNTRPKRKRLERIIR